MFFIFLTAKRRKNTSLRFEVTTVNHQLFLPFSPVLCLSVRSSAWPLPYHTQQAKWASRICPGSTGFQENNGSVIQANMLLRLQTGTRSGSGRQLWENLISCLQYAVSCEVHNYRFVFVYDAFLWLTCVHDEIGLFFQCSAALHVWL